VGGRTAGLAHACYVKCEQHLCGADPNCCWAVPVDPTQGCLPAAVPVSTAIHSAAWRVSRRCDWLVQARRATRRLLYRLLLDVNDVIVRRGRDECFLDRAYQYFCTCGESRPSWTAHFTARRDTIFGYWSLVDLVLLELGYQQPYRVRPKEVTTLACEFAETS